MFLLLRHEKIVIYSKLVNNPFKTLEAGKDNGNTAFQIKNYINFFTTNSRLKKVFGVFTL